jgi:hypothetical protein
MIGLIKVINFNIGFNSFGSFMINKRYMLFNSTPILKDKNGHYSCDPFWAKDLRLHLGYISRLVLCCPVIETDEKSDMPSLIKMISYNFGDLADITNDGIEIIPFNPSIGWLQVFKNLVPNFLKVKQALSADCIVHSVIAGQGLSIVASYTECLKTICKHQQNSTLSKTGDANALAQAMTYAVTHPSEMLAMGLEGLKFAQTKTHQRMHEDRASFLDKTLKLDSNQ